MKLRYFLFAMLLTAMGAQAQKPAYRYVVDLQKSGDDQFHVELTPPTVKAKTIEFHMPKTVPGTYSNDDYGYFVNNLKALDKSGKELGVSRLSDNIWQIQDADKVAKITYQVNDTYDDTTRKAKVFEPTGSNIQHDTVYVMNTYTVAGYFKGMDNLPYELQVKHQPGFYGATAMTDADKSETVDRFTAVSYNELADNPVMYTRPDTATIRVGGAEILISVYSPNKVIGAKYLASQLDSITQAQVAYLGGTLPVNKYAYLIRLFDKQPISNAAGALEHSQSSMYSLSESRPEVFAQTLKDVAAHEFFHILTPLNVHAEEIQYFNFSEPKMSEHLWLYEGSTEYHAHKAQLEAGLITLNRFLNVMGTKITNSRTRYKDSLSFTDMSRNILEPANQKQYGNVYEKGALISLCLDIKLRQLSNGRYGLINLVQDLSKKYGKGKPFKDEELFNVIGKISYPQVQSFLQTYVQGSAPLPFEEVFNAVGIEWQKDTTVRVFSMGAFGVQPKGNSVYVSSVNNINDFGKKMGYKVGDTIVTVNGTPVHRGNYQQTVIGLVGSAKEGDVMKVEVVRIENGEAKRMTLEQTVEFVNQKRFNVLRLNPNPTEAQRKLRESWMNVRAKGA